MHEPQCLQRLPKAALYAPPKGRKRISFAVPSMEVPNCRTESNIATSCSMAAGSP